MRVAFPIWDDVSGSALGLHYTTSSPTCTAELFSDLHKHSDKKVPAYTPRVRRWGGEGLRWRREGGANGGVMEERRRTRGGQVREGVSESEVACSQ